MHISIRCRELHHDESLVEDQDVVRRLRGKSREDSSDDPRISSGTLLAITAVIISFQTSGILVTALSIAIVVGVTALILRYVDRIYKVLGRRGSIIVTRVFAVFIAAIAVQFIVEGAKDLFGIEV